MKKKLLLALSALVCALLCAFGIAACAPNTVATQAIVTLQANGGAFTDGRTAATITVDVNGSIDGLTPYPVKDGYVFDGWAETENGGEPWDLSEKKVAKNITLYAVWGEKVTVTYFANGGAFDDETETIESDIKKGSKPTLPDEPDRDGYAFGGWYIGTIENGSVTLGTGFDSNTTVNEDITVYAKWTYETGKPLMVPTGLTVKNNGISWNAVEGANGYRVIILDDEDRELTSNSTSGASYSYNFASRGEGSYKIRVRAVGDGINYTNSAYATTNYAYELTSLDISFDAASSELTWEIANDDLATATSYDLTISEVSTAKIIYSERGVEATSFDMSSYDAGTYRIQIVSNKDDYSLIADSLTFTKLRLATPNVTTAIEGTDEQFTKVTLSWNAVKYASTYIITIGQRSVRTSNLTYSLTADDLGGQPIDPIEPTDPIHPVDPVTRAVGGSARADFASEDGVVAVRAFDENYDYLVSLPAETVAKKSALVKIEVTNDSTASGSTSVNGSLYQYNEPPYRVYFDYFTNLNLRFPTLKNNRFYTYRIDHTYTLSTPAVGQAAYYVKWQEVTATDGLQAIESLDRPSAYSTTGGVAYVCNGWYADKECTELFDFSAPVTKTTYVYAGWIQLEESFNSTDRIYTGYSSSSDNQIQNGIYRNDFTETFMSSTRSGTLPESWSDRSIYFPTTVAIRYDFKVKSASSGSAYETTVTIFNETTKTAVTTLTTTSTSWTEYSFNGKAGDIFRITFNRTGSSKCDVEYQMSYYKSGVDYVRQPTGGKAGDPNYGNVQSVASGTVYAVKGSVVTLTATPVAGKTFVGWFDGNDKKVSDDTVFTFTASADASYTAKWE